MGWFGDVSESLQRASRKVDLYPRNSLGWLLAAEKWNRWSLEATSEGNKWSDTGIKDKPTNCEWDENWDECPIIKVPKFDKNQILILGE